MALTAKKLGLTSVINHVEERKKKLERARCGKDRVANAVLQRHMRKKAESDAETRAAARAKARVARENVAKIKRLRAEQARLKEKEKEKENERLKKLDKLPKSFDADTCGGKDKSGGTKAHIASRAQCLERVKLRSPELSADAQAVWPRFVQWYTKWIGKQHEYHGVAFIQEVNKIMWELGGHFQPPPGGGKVPGAKNKSANKKALEDWIWATWDKAPKVVRSQTCVV